MRRLFIIIMILCLSLPCLVACGEPAEVLTEGELTVKIYTNTEGRTNVIKTYREGKCIDTWRVKSEFSYAEAPLRFVDLNFDGHTDMRILTSSEKNHTRYSCRLYSPDTDSFYSDTVLDLLWDPEIDSEAQQISAYYTKYTVEPAVGMTLEAYIDERGTKACAWIDGKLTIVARECITYYSESDIYCVAKWALNQYGELDAVEERWLSPEKYKQEGYPKFN